MNRKNMKEDIRRRHGMKNVPALLLVLAVIFMMMPVWVSAETGGKLKAPEFDANDVTGCVFLSWKLKTEDGSYSDPSGAGEVDHFNIYKNGKLTYRVAQNAVIEEEYQDGNWQWKKDYSWSLNAKCDPGILYSWQIAAVDKNGVEGYRSDSVNALAYSDLPEIAQVDAWFETEVTFNENGYDGLYYDPSYGAGTGKGVFLSTQHGDGYDDLRYVRIERKTLANGVDDGSDKGFAVLTQRTKVNVVNQGTEPEWVDRTVSYNTVYKYRITGTNSYNEDTEPYEIIVKVPAKGASNYVTFNQANVTYSIVGSNKPQLQFFAYNEDDDPAEFRLMRRAPGSSKFTTIKTYKGSLNKNITYSETPTADGTYIYRVDKIKSGVTIYGREYIYVLDQTPEDESMLAGPPSAPKLRASVLDGGDYFGYVMLRWSDTGAEQIDGYYIYRTDGGKYNTDEWEHSDGERGKDYPYSNNNRYIRLGPDKKSYKDDVLWAGIQDYDTYMYSPVTHKWWIAAYNEMGMSEPSEIITFEDQLRDGGKSSCVAPDPEASEKPGKPVIRKLVTQYSLEEPYGFTGKIEDLRSECTLTGIWTEAAEGGDTAYFNVVLDKKGENEWKEKVYAGGKYSLERTIKLPKDAGEYELSVTAVNAAGQSETAKQTVFVHDVPKLIVSVSSATSAKLEWCPPEEAGAVVMGYEVWYRDKYGIWKKYQTLAHDLTSTTVENLEEDVTYRFKVAAKCSDNVDRTSAEVEEAPSGKKVSLDAPENLSYKVMDGNIYLTWTPPKAGKVEKYEYSYEVNEGDYGYDWTEADEDGKRWYGPIKMDHTGKSCWVWLGFEAGSTKNVRIRACNSAKDNGGCSKWSDPVSVTLTKKDAEKASIGQPEPVHPTVTGGENKITITWKSIPGPDEKKGLGPGASYYIIQRRDYDHGVGDEEVLDHVLGDPDATKAKTYTYVDETAEPGIDYSYCVVAATSTRTSYPNYWFSATASGTTEKENQITTIREILDAVPDVSSITKDNYQKYEEDITALHNLYEGLTPGSRAMLTEGEKQEIEALFEKCRAAKAQAEYADLIAAANEVMSKLPDADKLTAENAAEYQKAVDEANVMLAKLPADALPGVDMSRLDAIKARFAELRKVQADIRIAKAVSDLISVLPDPAAVTKEDRDMIVRADAAYHALTADQKKYITEYELKRMTDCVAALETLLVPLDASMVVKKPADVKYTGNPAEPECVLSNNGTVLAEGTDFTVEYSNNTNVGTAAVRISGIGDYMGSITLTFKVNPKGLKISKVKAGRKNAKVLWKSVKTKMSSSRITGYQIQYSLKSSFKGGREVKCKGYKSAARTIKKLKGGKKYYFRIRTYMKTGGKTYYSSWSGKKTVKVRK